MFDPDKYLQGTNSFDPDQYLNGSTGNNTIIDPVTVNKHDLDRALKVPEFTKDELREIFPNTPGKPGIAKAQQRYLDWLKPRSNKLYLQAKGLGYIADTSDYEMGKVNPENKSWTGDMWEAIKRGNQDLVLNLYGNPFTEWMMEDNEGYQQARQYRKEESVKNSTGGRGFVKDIVTDTAGMLPYFAGGALMNAAGGPWGALAFFSTAGSGEIYQELKDLGIDDKIAAGVAIPAGLAYGLIENIQLAQALPGVKKMGTTAIANWAKKHAKSAAVKKAKAAIRKKVLHAALKLGGKRAGKFALGAGRYAATVGAESFEESMQEATKVTAEHIAAGFNNLVHDTEILKDASFGRDLLERSTQAFVQSIGPMSLIAGFGHGTYKLSRHLDKKISDKRLNNRQNRINQAQGNINAFEEIYGEEHTEQLLDMITSGEISLTKAAKFKPEKLNKVMARKAAVKNGTDIDMFTGDADIEQKPVSNVDTAENSNLTPDTPLSEISPELAQQFNNEQELQISPEQTQSIPEAGQDVSMPDFNGMSDAEIEKWFIENDPDNDNELGENAEKIGNADNTPIGEFERVDTLPPVQQMSMGELDAELAKLEKVIEGNPGNDLELDWFTRADTLAEEMSKRIDIEDEMREFDEFDNASDIPVEPEQQANNEIEDKDPVITELSQRFNAPVERADISDDNIANGLREVGKALSIPVSFVRMGRDTPVDGFEYKGEAFINIDSDSPALATLAHESVHILQNRHPELWDKFKNNLKQLYSSADFDKWAGEKASRIEQVIGKKPSNETMLKELAAYLIEEQAHKQEFWQNLHNVDASLLGKILAIFKEIKAAIAKNISGNGEMNRIFGKQLDQAIKAGEDFISKAAEAKKQPDAENKYLTMPIDVVKQHADYGVLLAKEALEQRKAELQEKEPVTESKKAEQLLGDKEKVVQSTEKHPQNKVEQPAPQSQELAHNAETADQKSEVSTPHQGSFDARLSDILNADIGMGSKKAKMKRLAKEQNVSEKELEERFERVIFNEADRIIQEGKPHEQTLAALLELYDKQPILGKRTSTSVANQAYSTPAPLAYLAGRAINLDKAGSIYEPTAGTGMLLIGMDKSKAHVNEIDSLRRELLKQGGYDNVSAKDATSYLPKDKFDAVIMNPPFDKLETPEIIKGYRLSKLDHVIAVKSLEAMNDNGTAAVIVGANRAAGRIGAADKVFMNYLYNHYNVTGNFEIDGKLYRKQGASFPLRLITINGRKATPGNMKKLAPGKVDRLDDWNYINKITEDIRNAKEPTTDTTSLVSDTERGNKDNTSLHKQDPAREHAAVGSGGNNDTAGLDKSSGRSGKSGRTSDTGSNEPSLGNNVLSERGRSGSDNNQSGDNAGRRTVDNREQDNAGVVQEQPVTKGKTAGNQESERDNAELQPERIPAENTSVREAVKPQRVSNFQYQYDSQSKANKLGTVVPQFMAKPVRDALAKIAEEYGNIDDFVQHELGYKSVDEMHKGLAAEQVDGVAMVINQLEQGQAAIIGDQTGIGKGRQAASIIRYAKRKNMIPVFITCDPKLYSDMYGDAQDIGESINPFMIGDQSKSHIRDSQGKILKKALNSKAQKAQFNKIANSGLGEYDSIFVTYSQFNKRNKQQEFLEKLANSNRVVYILDESHNGGGANSTTGLFLRGGKKPGKKGKPSTTYDGVLNAANGVVYFSATYAKRADNMPLYFRTGLSQAVDNLESLPEVISKGGIAMQQVIAKQLSESGQMIRRERDFSGVKYETVFHRENETEMRKQYDKVSNVFQELSMFSKDVREAIKDQDTKGTGRADKNLEVQNFSSVIHNYVGQLLLASKANAVVSRTMAALKKDQKVVIGLMNTMGSAIGRYAVANEAKNGDVMTLSFKDLLTHALDNQLKASMKDAGGKSIPIQLNPSELGVLSQYNAVKKMISKLDLSLPVSPLDYVLARLKQQGISVGEITGRKYTIDYSLDKDGKIKKQTLKLRTAREIKNKNQWVNGFNDGKYDVLVINQSGSTGLSLHASEKFKDQRQRKMIIAQPHGDINIVMQMFGRVLRSGQVVAPEYEILSTPLIAEARPMNLLSSKLKSLNANTTADSDSAMSLEGADLLNKYGDAIAYEMLLEDDSLAALDIDTGDGKNKADLMRKLTGRMAVLPDQRQRQILEELTARYKMLVAELKATGKYDLEVTHFDDWQAEVVEQETIKDGEVGNVFTAPVVRKKIKHNQKSAAPSYDSVIKEYKENFGDTKEKAHAHIDEFINKIQSEGQEYLSRLSGAQKNNARTTILQTLTSLREVKFRLGEAITISGEDVEYTGVLVNISRSSAGGGNPGSPSRIKLDFALADAIGKISLPLSKINKSFRISGFYGNIAKEFSEAQESSRTAERSVITGNILRGLEYAEKGQIISWKNKDGSTETGLLMPQQWDMKDMSRNPLLEFNSGDAAVKYMQDNGKGIHTTDNNFMMVPRGNDIFINTPKSRAKGGKYFLDEQILKITGDFETVGTYMRAQVNPQEAKQLVDILTKSQNYLTANASKEEIAEANKDFTSVAQETQGDDIHFSLKDDTKSFSKQLDDFQSGKLHLFNDLTVCGTPDVLLQLGARPLQMTIRQGVIRKITKDKHDISFKQLKKLPEALMRPVMIFTSKTKAESLVVLTYLKDNSGKSVVAAVHLNKTGKHHEVNAIASVYGKDGNKTFINWIKQGRLRYINKYRAAGWAQSSGLQLPGEAFPDRSGSLQNPRDPHNSIIVDKTKDVKQDTGDDINLSLTSRDEAFKDWVFETHPWVEKLTSESGAGKLKVDGRYGNQEDISGSFLSLKDGMNIEEFTKIIDFDNPPEEQDVFDYFNNLTWQGMRKEFNDATRLKAKLEGIDARVFDLEQRWEEQQQLDKDAPEWLKKAHAVHFQLDKLCLDIRTNGNINSFDNRIKEFAASVMSGKQLEQKQNELMELVKSGDKKTLIKELQNLHYRHIRLKALGKYEQVAVEQRSLKKQLTDQRKTISQKQMVLHKYLKKTLPKEARSQFYGKLARLSTFKKQETIDRHLMALIQKVDQEADIIQKGYLVEKLQDTFRKELQRMRNAAKLGRKSGIAYEQNVVIKEVIDTHYWGSERHYDKEKHVDQVNIHDMSKTELSQLLITIESIKQTGRSLKAYQEYELRKELGYQAASAKDEVIENAPGDFNEFLINLKKANKPGAVKAFWEKTKDNFGKYNLAMVTPETMIESLAGFKTNSAVYQNIWEPLYNGELEKLNNLEFANKNFDEIHKPLDLEKNGRKILKGISLELNVEHPGKTGGKYIRKLTLDELMFIYAHSKNAFSKRHLISTFKSYAPIDDARAMEAINFAIEQLPQNYKDVVDAQIFYYDNVMYDRINEVFRRMHGVDMPKEDNYFPIQNLELKNENLLELLSGADDKFARNTKKGFTAARQGTSNPFKSLSYMSTVVSNMHDVEQMIALSEPVWQVKEFLNNPAFKKSLEHKNKLYHGFLLNWVEDVAFGRFRPPSNAFGRTMEKLRLNFTSAVLGGNIKTPLKQPLSILQGATMCKTSEVSRAMAIYTASPVKTWNMIAEKSINMRNRANNLNITISKIMEDSQAERMLNAQNILPKMREFGFAAIRTCDKYGAGVVWLAKYNEIINAGGGEAKAIREADRTVRLTQPQGGIINLPQAYRSNEYFRWFASFTNQLNKNYNLFLRAIKDKRHKKQAFKTFISFVLGGTLIQFINRGFSLSALVDEPEEIARTSLNTVFGGHPALGVALDAAIIRPAITYARRQQGYSVPWFYTKSESSFLPPLARGPMDIGEALIRSISKGEVDRKTVDAAIRGGMAVFGVPFYYPANYAIKNFDEFKSTHDPRYLFMSSYSLQPTFRKKKERKSSNRSSRFASRGSSRFKR